ncbi:MAG: DUF4364 family protein [Oscillospiraceae bacterium]|nr:DUF4364 family protein [Oscillospiraceae bacterium]
MNEYIVTEINSVHSAKVLLCFLLDKLNRPVTAEQLYEIAMDSEVINYFYYTQALDELVKNESVKRIERDNGVYIELEEKGRFGSDYFNETVPYHFRKKLLKAAMYYFARLRRESEADVDVIPTDNGCEVRCVIKDRNFDLMRVSIYAPDSDHGRLIKEKIMLNPTEFYSRIIGYALENEEEQPNVDEKISGQ